MSNVRYKCPTADDTNCGARMFGAPGGTRLKCPVHDVVLEQAEQWAGATFEYVEDESGRSRTGRATHLRTDPRPDHFKNIKEAPKVEVKLEETPAVIKARLQIRYKQLFHKEVDKRIGVNRLRTMIAKKEEELEAASQAKSAEHKAAAGGDE